MHASQALYASGSTDRGKAVQCQALLALSNRVQDLFSASATRPSVSGDEAPQKLTFPGPESNPSCRDGLASWKLPRAGSIGQLGMARQSVPIRGAN